MPRATKRKSKYTAVEWKKIFSEVAKFCSAEAKRTGIRFQDCVKAELARRA